MSRATSCPAIIHDVQSYTIVQHRTFSIKIAELFEPKDGTLEFYLKDTAPDWLNMDKHVGILYGVGPTVPYNKRFKVTLTALNEMGHVTKSFIIVVLDTDVVETIHHTLENILSLRKQDYGYSHLALYTRPLSEYLYTFLEQEQYQKEFERSVHDAAKAKGIELAHEKISYHDFKSVMEAINPDFEDALKAYAGKDNSIIMLKLNNHQLRNLFRQGSQPTGTVAIPVWNHFGSPDLHNWPDFNPISNVLDAASDAVKRFEAYREQHQHDPKSQKQR